MARANISAIAVPGPLNTGLTAITWTALDPVNMNLTSLTGKEQILLRNDDAGAVTFTVTSAPISGRSGDINGVSIPAGAYRMTQVFPKRGWMQTGGKLHFAGSDADLKVAILRHQ